MAFCECRDRCDVPCASLRRQELGMRPSAPAASNGIGAPSSQTARRLPVRPGNRSHSSHGRRSATEHPGSKACRRSAASSSSHPGLRPLAKLVRLRKGAGKPGRRGSRRRDFARDSRCATDRRHHDGLIRALPPSQRPNAPYLDSARIRIDDRSLAMSDRGPERPLRPWCNHCRERFCPLRASTMSWHASSDCGSVRRGSTSTYSAVLSTAE